MKGKVTKPFLIALFLILLLAPGIAFLVILATDRLVNTFTNQINIFTNYNYYLKYFQEVYGFSAEDTTKLMRYLMQTYNFHQLASMKEQLIYSILGTSLVVLGIVIIIIGAFLLNKIWKSRKALIVALIIFWIITITGFGLLAVGQYKYQWTNESVLSILTYIKSPKDIYIIFNPYEFTEEGFQKFVISLFKASDYTVAKQNLQSFLFKEFSKPLIALKAFSNNWIKETALWWIFLIQAGLISLVVAFEYTSYASHLVKPNHVFVRKEKIGIFGQNWLRRVWTNLKEPTIWNVLRISIILITLFILIEVILIITTLTNHNLNNLYESLAKFPYTTVKPGNILSLPDNPSLEKEYFLKYIISRVYYAANLPPVFTTYFIPVLGLSFLVIIWSVSFVLIKRFSYLSKGSIVLFYIFFLPLLFTSLFLFTYSQVNTNNLIDIANHALDAFKAEFPIAQITHYKSSILNINISNLAEWILFVIKILCVVIFAGIISFLLWKIYQRDASNSENMLPKLLREKPKKVGKKAKKTKKIKE